VLAIQDTTVVKSSGGGGIYLHACIALDAQDGAQATSKDSVYSAYSKRFTSKCHKIYFKL
jgi:hypothetical protein